MGLLERVHRAEQHLEFDFFLPWQHSHFPLKFTSSRLLFAYPFSGSVGNKKLQLGMFEFETSSDFGIREET